VDCAAAAAVAAVEMPEVGGTDVGTSGEGGRDGRAVESESVVERASERRGALTLLNAARRLRAGPTITAIDGRNVVVISPTHTLTTVPSSSSSLPTTPVPPVYCRYSETFK